MRLLRSIARFVFVLLFAAGCARPPEPAPVRIRAADLQHLPPPSEIVPGRAVILEVEAGETVPVDVSVDGDLVATAPDAPPVLLVAKRRFWIRLDSRGLSLSRDGQTFDAKPRAPGSFRFGVVANRERGLRGEIVVRTPTPRSP